ncbi:MAG: hypothetical protein WA001_01645 [Patescibacteria group bacterium]
MLTEFVSVQLGREELKEIHAALIQRAIVEDQLRREKGQEALADRPLLQKLEALLGEDEERLHMLDHELEDELWEYAWYAFTDEWAWFRAKRELEKELGADATKMESAALEKLVEIRYTKNFERYVAELEMMDEVKSKKPSKRQPKAQ